jgi:hypothetical protein
MPAEVRDRVHALARRARASRGLQFTDSDGVDLDVLYPDEDDESDYDPDDDIMLYDSDKDSDSDPANDGGSSTSSHNDLPTIDLPAPRPDEPAGVTSPDDQRNDDDRITGVNKNRITGVHGNENENENKKGIDKGVNTTEVETTGVDNSELEAYFGTLENELDAEIADLGSNYSASNNQSDIKLEEF